MITDTKTIFEHWTDEELQDRIDNAKHADPGMLEGVRQEIERRVKVQGDRERIEKQAAEARRKQQEAEAAEADQSKLEKCRLEMIECRSLVPEARGRIAAQLSLMARQTYNYGGRGEAFVMDALAMAMRGDKVSGLVDQLRDTEYPAHWSMTHPREPRVIVYFDEVFPAKAKKTREATT